MNRGVAADGGASAPPLIPPRTPDGQAPLAGPGLAAVLLTLLLLAGLAFLQARTAEPLPTALGVTLLGIYTLLCIARLEVAFILLLALTPFSMEMVVRGAGSALQVPTEPMLFLALAAWGARFLARRSTTIAQPALVGALMAALMACLVSIIDTPFKSIALKATANASWYALFGLFVANNLSDRTRWRQAVMAFIVPGLALTLYSMVNVATGHYDRLAGFWWGAPFFPEHGTFAAYLSFVFALALSLAIELRGAAKLALSAVALLTGAQIVLSLTRGAWIGLGVLALFLLVVSGRRLLRAGNLGLVVTGTAAAALLFAAGGTLTDIGERSETISDVSYVANLERLNRWYAGWKMFLDQPLNGVGFGTYSEHYLNYRRLALSTDQSTVNMGVHSEYLRVACETGVVGLAAAMLALGVCLVLATRAIRGSTDPFRRAVAVGLAGGLITYLAHAFVNNYLGFDKVAIPVWTAIGVLAAMTRSPTRP